MLIVHVLKKSAGIGHGVKGSQQLEENVEDLAEAFMVLITATGFLEVRYHTSRLKYLRDESNC